MLHLPFHLAMHIPDGYLSLPVIICGWAIAAGLITLAILRLGTESPRSTPLLVATCAALIFAAQMVNFPIADGTSGHVLGGTLASVLLGPWLGCLVMAVVFTVQAVVFQDGGITALGANIVIMGLIGTLGGFGLYQLLRNFLGKYSWLSLSLSVAIAAWSSVVGGSMVCAVALAVSGTVALELVLPAMVSWHLLIGIGEALISVAVISFVGRSYPELISSRQPVNN
ncbi:MAG: energy-coupling factor ABC transporter permease [Pseudanabaenaceae cyanobacterium bins.68]|nr:energy-coupling factor ABC transporter permease [Pseudanabaenaceae cyanobacterium bins.68]